MNSDVLHQADESRDRRSIASCHKLGEFAAKVRTALYRSKYGHRSERIQQVSSLNNDIKYPEEFPFYRCLNAGFVALVSTFGTDQSIVQAARVSYGKGTKSNSSDAALISYLLRQRHTSPFEMVEMKFMCRMPIFVARQWIRHRTANVNEYSGRYSEMKPYFFQPHLGSIAFQSETNKQGRESVDDMITRTFLALDDDPSASVALRTALDKVEQHGDMRTQNDWDRRLICLEYWPDEFAAILQVANSIENVNKITRSVYKHLLGKNIAREIARVVLPLTAYTEWYWKIDLHNLLHFLRLRLDSHAQAEIRVFAEAIAVFVKEKFPLTWEIFQDMMGGCFLTSQEKAAMSDFIESADSTHHGESGIDEISRNLQRQGFSDRRVDEFKAKMEL